MGRLISGAPPVGATLAGMADTLVEGAPWFALHLVKMTKLFIQCNKYRLKMYRTRALYLHTKKLHVTVRPEFY